MPDRELPSCFDPYLRYAIAADFTNFAPFNKRFDEQNFRVFLLVEFKSLKAAATFEKALANSAYEVEFSPVDRNSRHTTMRARKGVVADAYRAPGKDARSDPHALFSIWNDNVSRVELSLPLKPTSNKPVMKRVLVRRHGANPPERLIGILDDGCPFAATQFLNAGGTGTRVLGIWDQNQRSPIQTGNNSQFGQALTDFNYGVEFPRGSVPGSPAVIGLDDWIQSHRTSADSIDEDGCYADGGFATLKQQVSHGAHVMDVFAGRVPPSSRLAGSGPPSWKADTDLCSRTDVVFVQFPESGIRDATGVWLKAYVKDGIDYIMTYADPNVTKSVVVNISYGPTTGPHDGTAELEDVLKDLTTKFDGSPGKPRLEISLPAGNSYLSEGHVAYARRHTTDPDHASWTWRLLPDNTVLCFAEIWMETSAAQHAVVTLTSPSGVVFSATGGPLAPVPGSPIPPYTGVFAPLAWGSSTVWLLAVEPTIATSGAVAEHGDWTVTVKNIDVHARVHAYVARSDPNMGVYTGAKRSYFVDPDWERTRGAYASCSYVDGEFDHHGSLVHRNGTLNGIATGMVGSVHVAGSYIISNGRKSPYSSAGPARGGPRLGPDYVMPGDESCTLTGIRAGGNRSGAVFRLVGTSTAAPQLGRDVADAVPLQPSNIPGTPAGIGQRGGGNLPPP